MGSHTLYCVLTHTIEKPSCLHSKKGSCKSHLYFKDLHIYTHSSVTTCTSPLTWAQLPLLCRPISFCTSYTPALTPAHKQTRILPHAQVHLLEVSFLSAVGLRGKARKAVTEYVHSQGVHASCCHIDTHVKFIPCSFKYRCAYLLFTISLDIIMFWPKNIFSNYQSPLWTVIWILVIF